MKMKYTAALPALLLAACMNPNDAFFQGHRYKMLRAELTGQDAVFQYGYPKKPDHDLMVNQVRVPPQHRASFEREWIEKECKYRQKDCTLQQAQSKGMTYYTCDAAKGFNGVRFVVYVVNMKADKAYVKVYRGMKKPEPEALDKLVAALHRFYP